ncbi:DNA-3-methyladenine glycosylase II [Aspergillus foveolatus]|uniref:DNA-3-methyladenine glycosylase II n=1 Tax=Aspergillus foveolatus TaxID=210207 RepID=UPI003CCD21EF
MALRRSTRLSALLPLKSTAQAATSASQRSNGITKTRKLSTKEKKKKTQTIENLNSHAQSITDSDPDPTEQTPTTVPPLPPSSAVNSNTHNSNYWEGTPISNSRLHTPPPLDRPVEPHRTNATLLTPHGSSLVAYPPGATGSDISPSKPGLPRPTATTGTLLEKATAHLIATDPRLEPLIKAHHCALFSPEGLAEKIDPFRSLVGTIIGQQVSGAAARSIREKFVALLWGLNHTYENGDEVQRDRDENEGYFPTPEEIVRVDIPTLRTAGLSQRKAEYIHGLAEKFASGELSATMLLNASDEELLEKLTAVRGLGRWSVEMFACFTLKRTDVFSTGDLGVQRGCAAFLGKDVSKLKAKGGKFKYMSEKEMLDLAAKFAPYRSLFMWYMWRVEEVDVTVMTG